MKSVLISIQPKWCELIANGKKTIEVRKTKPKLKTPFKVYIYCTKNKRQWLRKVNNFVREIFITDFVENGGYNGKVIGEFVCDWVCLWDIYHIKTLYGSKDCYFIFADDLKATCLEYEELVKYGNGKELYGWHISNLKIYDKPRELGEFSRKCEKTPCEGCEHLKYQGVNSAEYDYDCEFLGNRIPITRPPQSWCYVESEDKK